MKIIIINNYDIKKFEGTNKECLTFLRDEAKKKRRESRQAHRLPDNVMPIPDDRHQSKLVTMGSFEINDLNEPDLLALLNGHGSVKYSIEK